MKAYTKTKQVDVIWIKFNDSNIGHDQAKKLSFLYIYHISKYWNPILQIEKPISSTMKMGHLKIHRKFSIQLVCACTIHRSEGLTLDNTKFDPSRI